MIGASCIFEFCFFKFSVLEECECSIYCSLIILNMFVFVNSVVFIQFSEFIMS